MTNAQIIMMESVKLMEKGIISTTGRKLQTLDGRWVDEPEAIHTFASWKNMGYKVKSGEHAIASFPIWKFTTKKVLDENKQVVLNELGEEMTSDNMFMKVAFFFKASQVEKMEVK